MFVSEEVAFAYMCSDYARGGNRAHRNSYCKLPLHMAL